MKLPDSLSRSMDAAHFLARCYRYRLRTERLQIKTLMKLRLRGATVIDVGANKGIYCYWLTRAVGSSGRVLAVEPQPEMFAGIGLLRSRYDWTNLQVLDLCLSDTEGTRLLSREKVGDGSASLEQKRHRGGNETILVKTTRLDAISHTLSNLKFIKCDVEGHELALLWQIVFSRLFFTDFLSAIWALLRRRPKDEIDDGVTYGWHGWLRRRPVDSFFSAPRMRGDDVAGRRRRSLSSKRGDEDLAKIALRSDQVQAPPSAADAPAHKSTVP